jgi:hypothetical protein
MKLHGNAALSWTGRRRLAERVVVEGWTLTPAAAAAGVSVRCARKWVGRYPLEGPAGLARSLPAAAAAGEPNTGGSRAADRCHAPAALDRRRDLRAPRDGALDRLGHLDPARPRPAGTARARTTTPLRALAAGRARPYRRQAARTDRGRGRQRGLRKRAPTALQPRPQRSGGTSAAAGSATNTCTSASTTSIV